jgi:long-subunit fatty acid transport protein
VATVMPSRFLLVRSIVFLLVGGLSAAVVRPAHADGGLFSGAQGAHATARGGAYTAKASDLSAVMLNPAGLGHLEGTLIHIGDRASYNTQEFTRTPTIDYGSPDSSGNFPTHTFATARNQLPLQAVDPMLGVASHLGLERWTFALAAQAPPGVARQSFPVDGGQRYLMVDYEALMLNYSLTAAWCVGEKFGLGLSAQWIHVPRLKYSLVINANPFIGGANPVSSNLDMLATLTGSAPFALNTVVGAWYRPVPSLEIGIAGQVIPTRIRANGHLDITPVSSGTSDTVELSRDSTPANDVTVTIPLPLMARTGVRYRHLTPDSRELFDIELDVVYETWSRVDHFTVETRGLVAKFQGQTSELGDILVDKRWQDTVGIHLGGDYAPLPNLLVLSGGAFYQTALADPSYANVDFVTGSQVGGAVGASIRWHGHELALAYEYRRQLGVALHESESRIYQTAPLSQCKAPYTDKSKCSKYYLGIPGPPVNAGTYRASSHLLVMDWLYHF